MAAAGMAARAEALRGPWWWRLRCRIARLAGNLAVLVEPDDRSSMSWYGDDGDTITTATIRLPPGDS